MGGVNGQGGPTRCCNDADFHGNLIRVQTRNFDDLYERLEPLGRGALATVTMIRRKRSTLGGSSQKSFLRKRGKWSWIRTKQPSEVNVLSLGCPDMLFALKEVISKPESLDALKNEVELLKCLDHPNIIKAYETFEINSSLAIVMELCSGGDLNSRMPYTEQQAADIVRQLASAVTYMHNRNVVHRDLKLENIMFENERSNARIKIIDYGLSKKYLHPSVILTERVGTLYSMAPEAIKGIYTSRVDLWSIGVIAYVLLSGMKPFQGTTPNELVHNIYNASFDFESEAWNDRSEESKEFISALLQLHPSLRPAANRAKHHPWLMQNSDPREGNTSEFILTDVRESIIRFAENGDFKRFALNLIAKRSSSDDVIELREVFDQYDEGNDGFITLKEFKKVLIPCKFSDADVETIFSKLDVNKNGVIMYTEFLAAALGAKGIIEEHRIAEAFDVFDSDDTGFISRKNIRRVLGKQYSSEYAKRLIVEMDRNGDRKISYPEFKEAFAGKKRVSKA